MAITPGCIYVWGITCTFLDLNIFPPTYVLYVCSCAYVPVTCFFQFGDPLQSVYNNSILGTWMLPVAQNSAFCNRGSAVGTYVYTDAFTLCHYMYKLEFIHFEAYIHIVHTYVFLCLFVYC